MSVTAYAAFRVESLLARRRKRSAFIEGLGKPQLFELYKTLNPVRCPFPSLGVPGSTIFSLEIANILISRRLRCSVPG